MCSNPHQLGQRKVGQCGIGSQLDQPLLADRLIQHAALLGSALVAPDQRGPKYLFLLVQQDSAVHLSGEANRGDFALGDTGLLQQLANRLLAGIPPVARILLRPSILR